MSTRVWTLLLGLVAYLVFLVTGAPADRIAGWLAARVPGLAVEQPAGTLSSGSAPALHLGALHLGETRWHWRPQVLPLGRLELAAEVFSGDFVGRLAVGRGLDGPYLRAVRGSLEIAALARALGLPETGGGRLLLDLDEARPREDGAWELAGAATWVEARIDRPVAIALGEVRLDLEPTATGTQARLSAPEDGPLWLQGTLDLEAGTWRLRARLGPGPGAGENLRRALALLGRPDADGRVAIRYDGRL